MIDTVLILGAGSDIGVAIARRFAAAGYGVQLAARNLNASATLSTDIRIRYGVPCNLQAFDAGRTEDHRAFFDRLEPKPDVVVYVIGFMDRQEDAFEDWDNDQKIIDANYSGAVSILNRVAAHFADRRRGVIIGISSVAGDRGRQSNYVYGSAKAGFSAYLSGLRNRLFPFGVHVITVKPGFVYTKMTEGLPLPGILTATPQKVAERVFQAAKNGRNVVYVKGIWRWIMLAIRLIPEPLFKRMKT
jgi:short-subunit dehydrogenase